MILAWSLSSPSVVFIDGDPQTFESADLYVDAGGRPVLLQARALDKSTWTIPWSQIKTITHA
jgi:hypothetical protein